MFFNFLFPFFLILLTFVTNSSAKDEKVNNVSMIKSSNDKYMIKYLTSYTEYPVKLIDNHKKPGTKWYKHI